MSELIVSWLNTDVGLSRKVSSIERDFANGYLFGELLHKCGFVPCLEDAVRGLRPLCHSCKRSFAVCPISASLRALGLGVLSD